ncbi:MAG: transcriptional regulator [Candidatus Nanoarchaeia archaeon]|nr:transcriptional regulator [Candidatus Nanoarchaeia archaeon]
MKQPQEIEANFVIPSIRKALAVELSKSNINQKNISELLGISDAAVCQYVKSKRATANIKFSKEINAKIKDSAKNILKDKSCVVKEINSICSLIRKTKCLCRIHKGIEKTNCKEGCCCQ